jgi:hypothetical protein
MDRAGSRRRRLSRTGFSRHQRAKGLDFRRYEIGKRAYPRRPLHVTVHKQVVRRHQTDIVDDTNKLTLAVALKGQQRSETGAGFHC